MACQRQLAGSLVKVVVLHSNADYTLPCSNGIEYLYKSDHDPVIAIFDLP